MIVVTCDQRSETWFSARLGRLTGSKADLIFAPMKRNGEEPAARRDYRVALALERITQSRQDSDYINADMQRGIDLEPAALAAYEALTGDVVTRVGFLAHDELMAGHSPDGLVGSDGMIEIKCPKPSIQLGYHKAGVVPADYLAQLRHGLWISGCEWCDFFTYAPPLKSFMVRLHRKDVDLAAHELTVRQFLREVDATVEELKQLVA